MRTRAEQDWEPEVATPSSEPRSNGGVGQAVKEVTDRLKTILTLEIELAKLEVSRKIAAFAVGIAMLVGAAVLALFAVGFLLAALATGLDTWMPHWLADLAVGLGLLFLLVLPLALIGKKKLASPPVPKRAIHEAKLTSEALKSDGA
ncbi:MAG: phage holin family protein [Actinomycetota bacterium]|nr:phage holin family protein [Actinomycetota bacterium]